MRAVVGYHLDTAAYPDALRDQVAVVGTVVTGLRGLVGTLETQLGLVSPVVSETRRIAQWEDRIRRLLEEHCGSATIPFSRSFAMDPWNTAKELLRRREELVLAGWDPLAHQGGSRMLEALATLEQQPEECTSGFADRVRELLRRLQQPAQLELTDLTILDEEDLWEPWFGRLVEGLRTRGVRVRLSRFPGDERGGQARGLDSDLALLQEVQSGEAPGSPMPSSGPPTSPMPCAETPSGPAPSVKTASPQARGDGSLVLVRAQTERDAADALVSWLEQSGLNETVVIHQQPSILLDEMMHQRGLPALGADKPSPWRSILQVLPLTVETYWKPLRLNPLLQLLTLPCSPVPSKIRDRLASVLSNAPGVGGSLWLKAIDEGFAAYEESWQGQGLDASEIKKRRAEINQRLTVWVSHETYNPDVGIPTGILIHICLQVEQWAVSQMALTGDVLYGVARDEASQAAEAVRALNMDCVPRLHLARVLDSVLSEGVHLSDLGREAATWHVVNHPGQVFEPADTVLWWGFHGKGGPTGTKTWTSKERQWLASRGVVLQDESLARRREAAAWRRAVSMAKRRLILFAPVKVQGEAVELHPLWDEIRHSVAWTSEREQRIVYDASKLREQMTPGFAGAGWERMQLAPRTLPKPIREWQGPKETVAPRETESATSFDLLLGCPLAWTLQYGAKVRKSRVLSVPPEPIMLGLLAHEVLRSLLTQSRKWEPDAANAEAGKVFDELVEAYAAPLLEPQNGTRREETKWRLQRAVERFFTITNAAGIEVEAIEHELQRTWKDGIEIAGRLDLIAKTVSGTPMVIDAKWSQRPKRYRQRLEGLSTQLTLYHWLLAGEAADDVPVAYFMLRNGEFFSHPHPEIPAEFHVDGPNFAASLEVLRAALESAWARLREGAVVAAGIPVATASEQAYPAPGETAQAVTDNPLRGPQMESLMKPPCKYCEFKNLCGLQGGMA